MIQETTLMPLLETLSEREAVLVAQCNLLTQRLSEALMTDPISAQLSEGEWWETALKARDERLQRDLTAQITSLQRTANQLTQYNEHLSREKQRLEHELTLEKSAKQPPSLRVLSNQPPYTEA